MSVILCKHFPFMQFELTLKPERLANVVKKQQLFGGYLVLHKFLQSCKFWWNFNKRPTVAYKEDLIFSYELYVLMLLSHILLTQFFTTSSYIHTDIYQFYTLRICKKKEKWKSYDKSLWNWERTKSQIKWYIC